MKISTQSDLNKEETVKLIIDYFHRSIMHHVMWYGEVQQQFGRETALEALKVVYEKSYDIQFKRLSKNTWI